MSTACAALFCDHLSLTVRKYLPTSKMGDAYYPLWFVQILAWHFDRDILLPPASMMAGRAAGIWSCGGGADLS